MAALRCWRGMLWILSRHALLPAWEGVLAVVENLVVVVLSTRREVRMQFWQVHGRRSGGRGWIERSVVVVHDGVGGLMAFCTNFDVFFEDLVICKICEWNR